MQSMVRKRCLWNIALALTLLVVPVATSAEPGRQTAIEAWWNRVETLLVAFVAGAESGPAMDPGGLQAEAPADDESSGERGPEMDPGG